MANPDRYAGYAIAALAGAMVIAGLMIIGGPGRAQQEARDRARLDDLQSLAATVDCLANGGPPPAQITPSDLCPDPPRQTDPQTGAPYLYEVLDSHNYRLCATFERPEQSPATQSFMQFDGTRGCLPRRLDHSFFITPIPPG
ncbi:MAG: hypothetical protein Q4G36_01120 [Paracoccus sp. (in: a-proteobacteria)]|nr:hypothetical protein [Paracoccus sp. (in: a-proteobacteria)]